MILLTGANGFVGRGLFTEFLNRNIPFRSVVRRIDVDSKYKTHSHAVGDIGEATNWYKALNGIDCVIHSAARAHVMQENEKDALAAYRSVNVDGTRCLAEQAAAAGVRRLVYISSIKVNGETTNGLPYPFGAKNGDGEEINKPAPKDPYGVSKWEAEKVLWTISEKTNLEVVVVRPPLVYGPGVKGNLNRLLKLVRLGFPLPLGNIQNQRSLIGLDNLVDLLIRCVYHIAAAGQTFLVSDGEDLSTPDLLNHMAEAMGRSLKLIPLPVPLLHFAGNVFGKRNDIDRLLGTLQIDSSHIRKQLDWVPPVSVIDGIRRMVHGT